MTLLTSRNKETTPHHQQVSVSAEVHNPLGEAKDLEESENIEEFSSRAETPKETLKRKMSSPLVLIRKVSSNVMQTVSVSFCFPEFSRQMTTRQFCGRIMSLAASRMSRHTRC